MSRIGPHNWCTTHVVEERALHQHMSQWMGFSPWTRSGRGHCRWWQFTVGCCPTCALAIWRPSCPAHRALLARAVASMGGALLHVWADAFLNWPDTVRMWASMVADGMPGVSAGSPDSIATSYANMSVELARQCDSDDMAWMHAQLTTGSQQVLFGPAVWLSIWGMTSCAPPCKRQNQGQAATGDAASRELEVALGRAQKIYMVVADNAVWK